jgi:hypothetical protein
MQYIMTIKYVPDADPAKGKAPVIWEAAAKRKMKEGSDTPIRPWRIPPEGHMKINVDGSFSEEESVGGTGMVLRDERGAIIASASCFLKPCHSPT